MPFKSIIFKESSSIPPQGEPRFPSPECYLPFSTFKIGCKGLAFLNGQMALAVAQLHTQLITVIYAVSAA